MKDHITTAEYEQCLKMVDALTKHPVAASLLFGSKVAKYVEHTITWNQPNDNILSKARLDGVYVHNGKVNAIDLKTTRDASPKGFAYAVSDYGYHIQEAWYRRGLKANNIHINNFYFIAVESEEPYGVGVYTLAPEWIMAADRIIDDLLPIYAECEKTGVWPAYSQEVQEISCPAHIAGVLEAKI